MPATSTQALAYIRLLYDVEDQAKESAKQSKTDLAAERYRLRQELAVPRAGAVQGVAGVQQAQHGGPVLPKSPMGQAITYALNQWDALCVYTTDGDLRHRQQRQRERPAPHRHRPQELAVLRLATTAGTPPRSSSASSPPASATRSIRSPTCATC